MNTTPTSGADGLPEALIHAGMQALLQCTASELENLSPTLFEGYAGDVQRVFVAMTGKALSAALSAGQATAAQAVVPAGWKLVPEQPTLPMLIKGSDTDTSTSAEDCRRVYRAMLAAAPAQPAAQQGVAYAALPESFLEIPDVQDESGINAYYSREVVLECIDAALASHGQASSQAGEYPALVCDYCGALTPDPWHSSGMLHGKMSKHIHSCDACAARGAAQAQDTREPLTDEQIQDLLLCGNPTDEEMRLIRIGWDAAHGSKGGQHDAE